MSQADYSAFTAEQLAQYLGLQGGNWAVEFDEELFCGFVITETTEGGEVTKKYHWSRNASKNHEVHLIHEIEGSDDTFEIHKISCTSSQKGEWKPIDPTDPSKGKVYRGGGWSSKYYQFMLPIYDNREQSTAGSVGVTPESPNRLYKWTSKKTKQALIVEIVFAKDTEKVEQAGAVQTGH